MALGGLGGFQLSLQNLEDASKLLESAWSLLAEEGRGWKHLWSVVALNRLMVLTHQRRFDIALPLAEAIIAAEHSLHGGHKAKRKLLLAHHFAQAGQAARAQGLLDESRSAGHGHCAQPVEWVWVQAHLWNGAARYADALRIYEDHLEAVAQGGLTDADMPEDLFRLHNEATIACEALGKHEAALKAQRAMIAAERQQFSTATRAHRTTLQIQFELDSAQRDRDEAQRRGQDAAREQARLGELNAALHEANEAKTRFLAAASHDLRLPVQTLTMYMAALKLESEAAQRADLVERMDQSLSALSTMFDVLLDMSRLDAGLVQANLATLPLADLLARLVDEHHLRAREHGLSLRLRLPPQAAAAATRSDAVLMERCLRNLVDNAIKYTERGGVIVRLNVEVFHAPGRCPAS